MWEGYVCLFSPQFLTFSESQWLAIIQVIKILAWVTRSYRIWSHPHCRFILLKICILHSRILNSFLNVLFYFPLFSIPFYTALIYLKTKNLFVIKSPVQARIILKDCLCREPSIIPSSLPALCLISLFCIYHSYHLWFFMKPVVCYLHYLTLCLLPQEMFRKCEWNLNPWTLWCFQWAYLKCDNFVLI